MLILLTLLATAAPPPCQRDDGPGLCLGRADLVRAAETRADLDQCLTGRARAVETSEALAAALADTEARLAASRRARGRWVALGVGAGVAASGLVVWAGVQVVGAR